MAVLASLVVMLFASLKSRGGVPLRCPKKPSLTFQARLLRKYQFVASQLVPSESDDVLEFPALAEIGFDELIGLLIVGETQVLAIP